MSDEERIEVRPAYGICVQPDTTGKLWMGLTIQSESVSLTSYLCRSDNYEEVARELHKGIMEAGREMRKAEREAASGLVIAKGEGDINGAVQAERRIKRGPRSTG